LISNQFGTSAARDFDAPVEFQPHRPESDRLRRYVNVIVAVLSLVVAAPMMILIAILIKLTSKGPIVYTQTRVGVDRRRCLVSTETGRRVPLDRRREGERRRKGNPVGGRRQSFDRRLPGISGALGRRVFDYGGTAFRIYKFRTMQVAAGGLPGQVWASPDDPRVTAVGRFLRKYRLDELPQLVNVVLGDMNIVGPRPEQPDIFASLRSRIRHYEERQRVLPGITGWAQINHHYDLSVEDVKRKVGFDLEYLAGRSPTKDLEIMLRTVPIMLFKKGAW
jgi:lipopolysaccharide/colanic/teichoic acid biosynthesis glycosyltransferase